GFSLEQEVQAGAGARRGPVRLLQRLQRQSGAGDEHDVRTLLAATDAGARRPHVQVRRGDGVLEKEIGMDIKRAVNALFVGVAVLSLALSARAQDTQRYKTRLSPV